MRAAQEDRRALNRPLDMTTRQAIASFAWLALFALIALLGIVG